MGSQRQQQPEAPPSARGSTRLAVRGLTYVWAPDAAPALCDVDLEVRAGELVWLGGPSGCGKSTLLRALAGVLPPAGIRSGGVLRPPGPRPALLLQNLETQLLCTTALEEVAFGLERAGMAAASARVRAAAALDGVGLPGFGPRAVDGLSAGEQQRVLLAAFLALSPRVLLLDEPTSQLDPEARRRLVGLVAALKARGHSVVVADHRHAPWAELADRVVWLKEGRASGAGPSVLAAAAEPPAACDEEVVLELAEVAVRDPAGHPVLAPTSLRVRAGERVLVTGPNGAGKSTLLRLAAGLERPAAGRVRVEGRPPRASVRPGRLALLFQSPERNLFEASVADEVAFTLRRAGLAPRRVAARVEEVLAELELSALAARSPLRTSFGEQHRIALASVLAPEPRLLLLDEPFAGLDPAARRRILDRVAREQARTRAAVVIASHDPLPDPGWAHRTLRLGAAAAAGPA